MRTSTITAIVCAAALAVSATSCGRDSDDSGSASPGVTSPVASDPAQNNTTLKAALSGRSEVPGPGDPDGAGTATITMEPVARRVCFDLKTSAIDTPTAAHIHIGEVGTAGDVKVPLDPPVNGSATGCKDIEAALLGQILGNPDGFYVNVHTATYPNGAVRGQLKR